MFHRGHLSVKGEMGSVKGETISANFWQGKVQIYRHFRLWWPLREGRDGKCEGGNNKCEFLARESANLSPILARQWWRHFRLTTSVSLSLSLSLSPIVPHAQYRKRFCASYNKVWRMPRNYVVLPWTKRAMLLIHKSESCGIKESGRLIQLLYRERRRLATATTSMIDSSQQDQTADSSISHDALSRWFFFFFFFFFCPG